MMSLIEQPVALAVGAAPGLIEQACGGTLALLRARGWRIALATVGRGPQVIGEEPAALFAPNHAERAAQAAAILEADAHALDVPALRIIYSDQLCQHLTELLRSVCPALVLTHGPTDGLGDLEETGRAVRQACLAAPAVDYPTAARQQATATARIAHLYYFDPPELVDALGQMVPATLVVDVSGAAKSKEKMIMQYAGVGADGPPVETLLKELRDSGQRRGQRAGIASGEGFRQHLGPPFPKDNLLRQVLDDVLHVVGSVAEP